MYILYFGLHITLKVDNNQQKSITPGRPPNEATCDSILVCIRML